MTYKTEDEMIPTEAVLDLEAVSQSLQFLANSATEVARVLSCASPQDRDRLRVEVKTLRRSLRQLDRETGQIERTTRP